MARRRRQVASARPAGRLRQPSQEAPIAATAAPDDAISPRRRSRAWRRLLPTPEARAFVRWGVGAYLLITALVLLASLRASDGRLVYVLDDPAIHLSIGRNLAEHGTWGVVPGHFESASSSPLWTALLSAGVLLTPAPLEEALALVLNVLGCIAVVVLLARQQNVLRPGLRRPLDALATAAVTVVLLFLPGATIVGMEHPLHLALLLAAVPLLLRETPAATRLAAALPYLLLALATITRLETAFVAAGLGAALILKALPWGRDGAEPWRPVASRVVAIGAASGLPLVAYAVVNQAMGQDWLPSSVTAKSTSLNGADRIPAPRDVMERLTQDPLLAGLVAAALALAIIGWPNRARWATLATALVVAGALHVAVAQVGWYERYQIYLIGLGLLVLAWAADDLPRSLLDARPHLVPLLVLVLLLSTSTKVALTVEAPRGVADTYEQRYQAARFLERYYDGVPVATGELGYVSLYHHGPVTDLYGLGDHEVVDARRRIRDPEAREAFWADLVERRDVPVVAMYPATLGNEVPDDWILVGTWTLPRGPITAWDRTFQFWATRPEEVAPLTARLQEFSAEMPDGVELEIQPLAAYRAELLMADRDGGG